MSLLSYDRYQYDSLILSKQTWAYPRQHLQQLLWCFVSVRLNLPEVEERKLCFWYTPTRRNHKELSLDYYTTFKVSISFIVTLYIDKDKYSFIVIFLGCLYTFTYVGLYVCFTRLLVCVFLCVRAYVKTSFRITNQFKSSNHNEI